MRLIPVVEEARLFTVVLYFIVKELSLYGGCNS